MERDAIQIEAEKRYAVREALAEGEAKGKAEGKVEIAKALLAEGVDMATITKCTGLSQEEIEAL